MKRRLYALLVAADLPSKTQLDKLGDRLRAGSRDEADVRALDDYRRSFRPAYDTVANTLKNDLKLEGTGRPAKTTSAIDPERITRAAQLDELRSSQEDSEQLIASFKKALATLLTDYYNKVSQGKK